MRITQDKEGQTKMPIELIIALIILAALAAFAFAWYNGIIDKIIEIGKSFLK